MIADTKFYANKLNESLETVVICGWFLYYYS